VRGLGSCKSIGLVERHHEDNRNVVVIELEILSRIWFLTAPLALADAVELLSLLSELDPQPI
jgi:hypothetical protein